MDIFSKAVNKVTSKPWRLDGETPTTEAELLARFKVGMGTDETGSQIYSQDPANFGFTWADVQAELTTATQSQRRSEITVERDRRVNLPVSVTLSTGKNFDVDMDKGGRANIGDLALMAVVKNSAGINTDFTFRDADNVDHQLTNNEVIEMGMQAAAAYDAIYKKSWALKAMNPIPQNYEDDVYWT